MNYTRSVVYKRKSMHHTLQRLDSSHTAKQKDTERVCDKLELASERKSLVTFGIILLINKKGMRVYGGMKY